MSIGLQASSPVQRPSMSAGKPLRRCGLLAAALGGRNPRAFPRGDRAENPATSSCRNRRARAGPHDLPPGSPVADWAWATRRARHWDAFGDRRDFRQSRRAGIGPRPPKAIAVARITAATGGRWAGAGLGAIRRGRRFPVQQSSRMTTTPGIRRQALPSGESGEVRAPDPMRCARRPLAEGILDAGCRKELLLKTGHRPRIRSRRPALPARASVHRAIGANGPWHELRADPASPALPETAS